MTNKTGNKNKINSEKSSLREMLIMLNFVGFGAVAVMLIIGLIQNG